MAAPFLIVPKKLFYDEKYSNLSTSAKMLYALLADRTSLSRKDKNAWSLSNGDCFVYFTQKEIMERLQCKHDKAGKIIKELREIGLIRVYKQKHGKPNKIVVDTTLIEETKPRNS